MKPQPLTVTRESLRRTVDELARRRDDLRLTLHLASADARAEWDKAAATMRRTISA